MVAEEKIHVEVALAADGRLRLVSLCVAPGTTVRQAFMAAARDGALGEAQERWLLEAPLGIFGERVDGDATRVGSGDRIEVYSPLRIDPKAARRARAEDRRTAARTQSPAFGVGD